MLEGTDPLCDVCRALDCLPECPNREYQCYICNDTGVTPASWDEPLGDECPCMRPTDQEIFTRFTPVLLASCVKPQDFVKFDELQQGKCNMHWCKTEENPGGSLGGTPKRQNTAYHQEIMNWQVTCDICQKELDLYWAEMWAEYNSGRL